MGEMDMTCGDRALSKRVRHAVAAVVLVVAATLAPIPSPSAGAAVLKLSQMVASLTVFSASPGGYDRDLFAHWLDEDSDGCNTRAEVLIAESTVPVTFSSGCTVASGSWASPYDGATWTAASDVDIDHVVPLAEAWRSGANVWSSSQRAGFANDLTFDRSLIAVTDNVNQSKGDRDPAQWMPPASSYHCTYIVDWVSVKWRWRLGVDPAERSALMSYVSSCGDPTVTQPPRADVPDQVVFSDVGAGHPFAVEIGWLAGTGLANGYPDGTFGTTRPVSRQALAAMIYRYSTGNDNPPGCSQRWYLDVATGSTFCGHIRWLSRTGLVSGYADGGFHPTAAVSRQALVTVLWRYADTAGSVSHHCAAGRFVDMPSGEFCKAITWASDVGIVNGYDGGRFAPTAAVSRQALAAFLARYDSRFGPSNPPLVVPDPPPPTTTTTTTSPAPPNPGDSKNCGHFSTWAEAQAWFDFYRPWYGDVAKLDADGDGIACESLPGAPR